MSSPLRISLGIKADPIEYRYSYEWLFKIMTDEGIQHLQIGSFFEIYQLEDSYFRDLRTLADDHGISISSMFTAHRELGGFFRGDPRWEKVARRNYERYIEIGALLGAERVGSNPGAVLRDRMDQKAAGTACYIKHMKELMAYATEKGVGTLTIEPMSCLAEPPTLPSELDSMAGELLAHHAGSPDTANVGYCADISHGYANTEREVIHTHMELLEASLPYLAELHLKNTDAIFNSTFGFSEAERENGIVDLASVRSLLEEKADVIPVDEIVAYLEIGGPKLGRDYTDIELEDALRSSLQHIKDVFNN
jgi:ribulose-phosphate 3-epimerase